MTSRLALSASRTFTNSIRHLSTMTQNKSKSPPLVQFGVLTDVQYADADNKPAWYDSTKTRYYRASLLHVKQAFEHWVSKKDENPAEGPSFALQLGDLIDGLNRNSPNSLVALQRALDQFDNRLPVFHVVGNHELYNFKRDKLVSLLRESLTMATHPHHDDRHLYYSFSPQKGVKVIALDCFEISTVGYDKDDSHYQAAADILAYHHGHNDSQRWDENGPLTGLELRFQEQNGGISARQLAWLDRELSDSDAKHEKVFVFGHVCLLPESCDPTCLLWNFNEVKDCFARHPCVVAYLSGHAHNAGNGTDEEGIHYLVFHGVIETSPDSKAFATLTLYEDHLEVEGHGTEPSLMLPVADRFAIHEKKKQARLDIVDEVENEKNGANESAIEGDVTQIVSVLV